MEEHRPLLSELLAHRRFLEELALRLTGERDAADDLVQQTWLAAIEQSPRHGTNLPAWLHRVVRHLHYRRRERERLSKAAELDPALPASESGAPETLGSAEISRRVAELVLALDEPYHSVVLLRFYEGKTPTQIAAQLGRPVNTITSQLARGLERLRAELDRLHDGDRKRWSRALLPLVPRIPRGKPRAQRRPPGAASRSSFRRVALSAGALLSTGLAAVFLTILLSERSASEGLAAEGGEAAPLGSRMPAADVASVPSHREPASALVPDRSATGAEESATEGPRVELEVVDSAGAPLAAARILATRGLAPMASDDLATEEGEVGDDIRYWSGAGRTNAQGRASVAVSAEMTVELEIPGKYVGFVVDKPGFVRSHALYVAFPPPSAEPHRVSLAGPSFTARGQVLDPEGAPVASALVFIGPEEGARGQEGDAYVIRKLIGCLTDLRGHFELDALAPGSQSLLIKKEGFLPLMDSVDEARDDKLLFVLQRGASLVGCAVTTEGDPVAGALVRVEYTPPRLRTITQRTTAGADGVFEVTGIATGRVLAFAQHPSDPLLTASQFLQIPGDGDHEWSPELDRHPPLRVRVLTDDDEPIPGAVVRIRYYHDWSRELITDEEGRVAFMGLPVAGFLAEVIRSVEDRLAPPCLSGQRLVCGERENTLVVPRGRLGYAAVKAHVIVGPDRPLGNLLVYLHAIDGTSLCAYHVAEGTSTLLNARVPPQPYDAFLFVERLGVVNLGEFEVHAGETHGLGPVVVPAPGTLDVDWRWPGDASQYTYTLIQLLEIRGKWIPTEIIATGQGPVSRTMPALPGRFEWSISKEGSQVERQLVDLRSNELVGLSTGP